MQVENAVIAFAGVMILASLALAPLIAPLVVTVGTLLFQPLHLLPPPLPRKKRKTPRPKPR